MSPEEKQRSYIKTQTWKKNNPEKVALIERRRNLKRLYGLSLQDYEQLLKEQNFKCALCDKTHEQEKVVGKNLAVDHCHKTGQVRGLLCNDCNRNLIRHRPLEVFRKAVIYLERFENG